MRITLAFLGIYVSVAVCFWAAQPGPDHNVLTGAEEAQGWKLLFDGKSFRHWVDPSKLTPPGDAWSIEDGCLKSNPKPRITEDLVSEDRYTNFELQWEWRIAAGGNSGVKYRIQAFPVLTDTTKGSARRFEDQVDNAVSHNAYDRSLIPPNGSVQIYVIGFEYQMIDNEKHPDATRGGLYQSGALYSIVAPAHDATKPVGEFNQSRLIVKGDHVEHWLNHVKVVDATLTPELLTNALSKRWSATSPAYKLLADQAQKNCPISLQNHGSAAWFRDIKVRKL